MANLFSRVGIKNGADRGDVIVYPARTGEINHPRFNVPLAPRPLDGPAMVLDAPGDRREAFVNWLVSPDNPFFARSFVNRVWKNFMGRGLVEAVDDIRDANPASNAALFEAVTRDFVAHRFDVKHLARTIMTSTTYQLSSTPTGANAADLKYHSHYIARRLPAEVILDAISQVTGVGENFPGFPGRRALQLPDAAVESYFLSAFGRPPAYYRRRFGAPAGTEHHAGAARHQRRHDQPQAERVARPDSGSGRPRTRATRPRSNGSTSRRSAGIPRMRRRRRSRPR